MGHTKVRCKQPPRESEGASGVGNGLDRGNGGGNSWEEGDGDESGHVEAAPVAVVGGW
jgi:hypothetical protein